MNTPAHLIIGAAAFGKPGQVAVTTGALLGALMPDISLYVMASWSLYVTGVPASVVFGEYYFSDTWQRIFAVDNSFVLWAIALGYFVWARRPALIAFAASGLLHLALDFPLHAQDARMQFWPLSEYVFNSPLSYWNPRFYSNIVAPLEVALAMLLSVFMLWRFKSLRARAMIIVLATSELLTNQSFGVLH
ncbi:MAG: cobalamin biosynthesis protein CobQ [Paracoccaceae bacterium]